MRSPSSAEVEAVTVSFSFAVDGLPSAEGGRRGEASPTPRYRWAKRPASCTRSQIYIIRGSTP